MCGACVRMCGGDDWQQRRAGGGVSRQVRVCVSGRNVTTMVMVGRRANLGTTLCQDMCGGAGGVYRKNGRILFEKFREKLKKLFRGCGSNTN